MKKKIIAAIVIIVVLVAAVFGAAHFNSKIKDNNSDKTPAGTKGSVKELPEIKVYLDGEQMGEIVGYTTKMNTAVLRDNIIVVTADDRKAGVEISTGKLDIRSVQYEIRTNDGQRLIDSGEMSYEKGEEVLRGDVTASTILEDNKEHSIVFILDTKQLGEVYYYSRLMVVADDFVKTQIAFAKDFSDSTMDSKKATKLVTYMEPDAEIANNNLGQVTLSNNYDLLTWGNLSPKKTTDTDIQLKEVFVKDTGISGTYQMKYQIQADGNNDIADTYDITETITVWTYNSQNYVLAYERDMNQVWEVNANNVRSTFIDLGIQNHTTIDFKQSKQGKYIGYVVNDQLWMTDVEERKFTKVYSLEGQTSGKAKILTGSVDDEGNMNFMICGYGTESAHIGMNGISVCRYDMKNNKVEEIIFVPYDIPGELLTKQVESLCYINDDVLYIMVDHKIHYVNLKTKETGIVAENLIEGNYAINADKDTIAYNTNGGQFDSDSITIVDLSTGQSKIIEAGEGCKIKVCGYSGNNLVYGIAPKSQINAKKGTFNMSSITIIDEELNELTSYSKNNIYISSIEITDSIINLKRVKKGNPIEDDQLIDNTEKTENLAVVSYYDDTKKYRELALSLKDVLTGNQESTVVDVPQKDVSAPVVQLTGDSENQEVYYVYSSGELKETFTDRAEAEQVAREYRGLVTDGLGEKIWTFEDNYEEE